MRVRLLACIVVMVSSYMPLQGDTKSIFQILFGSDQKTPFANIVEEKKDQVERLKEELFQLNADFKEKNELNQHRLTSVNQKIVELEQQISQEKKYSSQEKDIEFFNELMAVFTEQRRILTALQLARKQVIALIEERIALVQSYIKDPEFSSVTLDRHALYPMQVFVEKAHQLGEARNDIKELLEQQKEAQSSLEKAKRETENAQKSYQDKKRKQEEFKSKVCEVTPDGRFDVVQQGQLLDAAAVIALYEQELASVKLQVAHAQKGLLDSQLFFAQEREQALQRNFALVKEALRVDDADIFQAQDHLEKIKRAATQEQNALFTKITALTSQFEETRRRKRCITINIGLRPNNRPKNNKQ